jgi:hypothetical protein
MVSTDECSLKTILMTSAGPNASRSGLVETFHADLACEIGLVNSILVNPFESYLSIIADMSDGDCATGPIEIARTEKYHHSTEIRSLMPIGEVTFKQCQDESQPKLFVFFGQLDAMVSFASDNLTVYAFNSTVLVCTPDHTLQEAFVTTDSAGALIDVGIVNTSDEITTSPWDFWSAFNMSLHIAEPTFVEGYDHGQMGYTYDAFFAALSASRSRQPVEYLNPDTLMQDSRRLYSTTAGQIANRFMRAHSTRTATGSYKTTRSRVILKVITVRIIEAGLMTMIICACLMTGFSPHLSASTTGTTLASLAAVLQRNDGLKPRLHGSGKESLDRIKVKLSGQSFSLNGNPNTLHLRASEATLLTSSTSVAEITTWWRPAVFSIYMKIALLILPLAVIACLEATFQRSTREDGLGDALLNQYWHYAWTLIPASTMTLVSLLYSSVTWSVALLDPYSILRTGSVAAQHTLWQMNLTKPSILLTYQGLRLKRYALLTASMSALLAPLLTIIVSGLILVQTVDKTEGLTVSLADHISSPVGLNVNETAWNQASILAAYLLYQGYGSYPEGTYKNTVFPNRKQYGNIPISMQLPNASSITVDVGMIMSNFTCRVMDSSGFRYTVGFNGTNDPVDTDPAYGWSGGLPGDSWLNMTHVDLAGERCDDPGPHCDTGIRSLGVKLAANSTRFSLLVDAHYIYHTWADPSAWPNGDTLREAIAARNRTAYVNSYISFYYGTWNATTAHISGISCYTDCRQGRANITSRCRGTLGLRAWPRFSASR